MTFAQPLWIITGLVVCVCLLFLFRSLQSKRLAILGKFAAAPLLGRLTRNVSTTRRFTKKIILLLALFCCFLTLARPQFGFHWEDVKRKGIDILFALDTSRSMLAGDVKPSRLERAKLAVMDFVDQLDGDRVGLLPFAGSAFLMCPLTGDYQAFETSLKAVDTTIIPKGGTDIAAAIHEAESVLNNEANYKLLVLITDGENLEGDVLVAAQEAAKKGVRIFTVGVGTREGEIIPFPEGTKGFVKDGSGNFVVSRLDAATLTRIVEQSNGLYAPLGNKGQGLQTIYREKLALVPKETLSERRHKVPIERFQWPLGAAIGLLILDFMIAARKSPAFRFPWNRAASGDSQSKIVSSLVLLLICCLYVWPTPSFAAEEEKDFTAGKYAKASEQYRQLLKKHPEDPVLQFNLGTTLYKNNQFDEALAAFDAALTSKDLQLQEKAYYNRGNAHFKKGEATLKTDTGQTLAQWQEAIDSYCASLALQSDDQDALYNRKLVQQRLDDLKKNKDQPQQQQQKQKQDQKQEPKERKDDPEKGEQRQDATTAPPSQQPDGQPSDQHGGEKKQNDSVKQPEQKEQQEQPQAAVPQAEESSKAMDQAQAEAGRDAERDAERRKAGKMTREDAQQLLDSLKNEEGKVLHFVPATGRNNDDESRRNW